MGDDKKNEKGKKDALHLPKIFRKLLLFFFLFNSLRSDKMELIKRRQAKSQCQTTSEMKHSRKACKNSCQKQGGFHSPSCILMNYKEPQCSGADATFQEPCQDFMIELGDQPSETSTETTPRPIFQNSRGVRGELVVQWMWGGWGYLLESSSSTFAPSSALLMLHKSSSSKSTSLKVKFR